MSKLKQLPVGTQVLFVFGTLCAILLLIGGLLFFSLRAIERSNEAQQSRALNKLAMIDDTAQDVGQMQADVLRQVLASDLGEIKKLDQTVHDIEKTNAKELADYQKFTDTEKERQLYNRVMQARKAYWEQTWTVLALGLNNEDPAARKLINLAQAPAYDEFLQTINALIDYVETDAKAAGKAMTRFIATIRIIGDILVGVTILIAMGTARFVVQVTRRLREDNGVLQNEITERQRAQETLRLLSSAVEQAKESITITDANLDLPGPKIIFVNPAFAKMTGYTAEEVIGKTPRILQGPRTDKAVLSRLRQNLEQGETFEGETVNYRKDGGEFELDWQIAPICNSSGKTTHFVAIQRDVTERKLAENALAESNEKFRQMAENITDLFWITSPDMQQVHYVSRAYERIWGRSAARLNEHPQDWVEAIPPEERARVAASFGRLMAGETSVSMEFPIVRPDGAVRWIHSRGFQVRDAAGKLIRLTGIATDITERKRFETQLIQSQRLETVGKLAGGVAHEFNSILTAIIGQTELILGDLAPENRIFKNVVEIRKAADRAAVLTRQLLAYGRKQILQPENIDLNLILTGMESTLHHLVGRDVDVRIVPGAGLKAVKIDPGQIEQVIVNIVMNAAAVMLNGGKLTLETANVMLDQEYVSNYPELKAGEYVMLAITDTGTGISPELKKNIFEPFFSIKGVGQGTGLGLATCYGILKQSGGHINVYSELSRGATFKIYLPRVEALPIVPAPRLETPKLPGGTETILLVEDDPALREMASALLRRLGYTVLSAANGLDALNLKQQRNIGHIDLLFTDVVMPHMSGKELADRVLALFPHTRILFTSAYTENAIVHQGVLNPGMTLLQKPFTPSALAHKLREVLDTPGVPAPDAA